MRDPGRLSPRSARPSRVGRAALAVAVVARRGCRGRMAVLRRARTRRRARTFRRSGSRSLLRRATIRRWRCRRTARRSPSSPTRIARPCCGYGRSTRVENRALPGTEGASFPFWSPDGRTIGFFAEDKLKRIDVDGGRPLVIADAPNGTRRHVEQRWRDSVRARRQPPDHACRPTRGGPAERVTQLGPGSGPDHRWPQFLPDGKRFLFSSTLGSADTNGVYIGSLDKTPPVRCAGRRHRPLCRTRQAADDQAGSAAGVQLRCRVRQQCRANPIVIAQGFAAGAAIAVSDTGVLAYRPGAGAAPAAGVGQSAGRGAARQSASRQADEIGSPELSADEQSVVVFSHRSGDNDVWVIELARNLAHPHHRLARRRTRIRSGIPTASTSCSARAASAAVVQRGRRSTAERQSRCSPTVRAAWPCRGRAIAVTSCFAAKTQAAVGTGGDADQQASQTQIAVAQSQYDETEGQFSPDGEWVAFVSNESGRPEVFVQSFPEGRARTQVSTAGGTQVRWSGTGRRSSTWRRTAR